MIKTIFFDFGNVVAFFDHRRAVDRLASYTDLTALQLIALYDRPLVIDYEMGKISTDNFVREAMIEWRLSCTPDEFLASFCDIFWRNDEVCDLIPHLANSYRLVLASNTVDAHFRRYTADFADVFTHFDHLVASHHAGARKPQRDFFTYAQQFALAQPNECLFVDDLEANVATAREFGWKGLVYRADGSLKEKLRVAAIEIGKTT
jgi:putative hydrolase of the HAD superfamily